MPTIMLTGAGGAAVPGLIEHLKTRYGFRVLAADMDRYAAGLFWADAGFVIPAGNSLQFQAAVLEICQRESVDVFIPLVDEELLVALTLENYGIKVILPTADFVKLCLDKYRLMRTLQAANISNLETYLADEVPESIQFPLIVKPRTGRGSTGVFIVHSSAELQRLLDQSSYSLDQLIIQPYIIGQEFTISVVVGRNGQVYAVVPKEIIVKKGITRLAVTRHNVEVERMCLDIQKNLYANGPFNVQLRIDEKTGRPLIFEINPRFSTTTSLTIAAGIDEIGILIQLALGTELPSGLQTWAVGKVLVRRQLDIFMDESDFIARQALALN